MNMGQFNIKYSNIYESHYNDGSEIGKTLMKAQEECFVNEGLGVPVTDEDLNLVMENSAGKELPALLFDTTQQDYDDANFVKSRLYCTYNDLRSYKKSKQDGRGGGWMENDVLSDQGEVCGTSGGYGHKSPAAKELQKRVRETTKRKEPSESRLHNLRKNCVTHIDAFINTNGINDEDADSFEKEVMEARHKYIMRAKKRLEKNVQYDDEKSSEEIRYAWPSETNAIGPIKKAKKNVLG